MRVGPWSPHPAVGGPQILVHLPPVPHTPASRTGCCLHPIYGALLLATSREAHVLGTLPCSWPAPPHCRPQSPRTTAVPAVTPATDEKGSDSRPAKPMPTREPEPALEAAVRGPAKGPGLAVLASLVWPDQWALSMGQAQEGGATRTLTQSCLGTFPSSPCSPAPGVTSTSLPCGQGRLGEGRGPAVAGWGGRI